MDTQSKQIDITGSKLKYRDFLTNEAQGLLIRVSQLQPFEMCMPMVTAAAIPYVAQKGIFNLILSGKRVLVGRIKQFIAEMKADQNINIEKWQANFAVLKLRFNALLDQFEIFADVVSQRGENDTGVWVAGLDVLAQDALRMENHYVEVPPMICYLDRGQGAAIRRARTRLPGGEENPVAVIKIPRERMVASGIGSSLVHEVGHQASALLDLLPSLRPVLQQLAAQDAVKSEPWKLLNRWISEILSDMWAIGFLGISATTGLMGVVSLPRYFVFRAVDDDPHPFPWIRVKISLALGKLLYPEDQWGRLERLWESMYQPTRLQSQQMETINSLQKVLPAFARLVLHHKPPKLNGKMIKEIFPLNKRRPEELRAMYQQSKMNKTMLATMRPTMVFAMVGQARADNLITTFAENRLLTKMLRHWALTNI